MLVANVSEFDAGEYIESDEDASRTSTRWPRPAILRSFRPPSTDISKARGVIQIAAGEAGVGRETE